MGKLKFIILWCAMVTLPMYSQLKPVTNMQTPDAAMLGTYGQIPVSLFTGNPQISIPIYEMITGDYKLPITLAYHLQTVKPHIQAGVVGTGWSLMVGGQISRTVRGAPDERMDKNGRKYGYYYHSSKMKNMTSSSKAYFDDQIKHIYDNNNAYELTPDEFSFNFCGYTGNFYYNQDGTWTVVSNNDIKVEFDPTLGNGFIDLSTLGKRFDLSGWNGSSFDSRFFNKFTLITPDGCRYEFGGIHATEYSIPYYARKDGMLVATTWRLSKITTPSGRSITFNYETKAKQQPLLCDIHFSPHYMSFTGGSSIIGDPNSNRFTGMTGFLLFGTKLNSIVTDMEQVSFSYLKDPNYGNQFTDPTKCLYWQENNKIRFSPYNSNIEDPANQFFLFIDAQKGINIKETEKNIANSLSSYVLKTITVKNLFSDSVKTVNLQYYYNNKYLLAGIKNGTLHYSFSYNIPSGDYPRYILAKTDSWGYYNGGELKMSETPVYGLISPNLDATKQYTLSSVEYPTGGKSVFDYELNDYSQVVSNDHTKLINESGKAGGLRISLITNMDVNGQIVAKKHYYYTENMGGASSGILSNKPAFELNFTAANTNWLLTFKSNEPYYQTVTNMNSPIVGYSTVIEDVRDAEGKTLKLSKYRFSNFDKGIDGLSHYDENALMSSYSGVFPIATYSSKSVERGLLLSQEVYDGSKTLLERTTYTYQPILMGSFLTVNQKQIVFPIGDELHMAYTPSFACYGELTRTYTYSYLNTHVKKESFFRNNESTFYEESYGYNSCKQLNREVIRDALGSTIATDIKFPIDVANMSSLVNRHILSPIVEMCQTQGDMKVSQLFDYSLNNNGVPFLAKQSTFYQLDGSKKTDYEVLATDRYGNPTEIIKNGRHDVIYWVLNGQRMVAYIENAEFQNLKEFLPDPSSTSGLSLGDIPYEDFALAKDKRPDLLCYLYHYDGNLRLASVTEPNGKTNYYRYDNDGRLVESGLEKNHYDVFYGIDSTFRYPQHRFGYSYYK